MALAHLSLITSEERARFAAWRVWAAGVRDNDKANSGWGAALCALLDTWENAPPNVKAGLEDSLALLVGKLLLNGANGPTLPGGR